MQLAADLLKKYPNNKIWLLYGDLAVGKTTFTKGFAKALGIDEKTIKSPTFTCIKKHKGLIHYDLYRLTSLDEGMQSQLAEHLIGDNHILIEWPEVAETLIKTPYIRLDFNHKGDDGREIKIAHPL